MTNFLWISEFIISVFGVGLLSKFSPSQLSLWFFPTMLARRDTRSLLKKTASFFIKTKSGGGPKLKTQQLRDSYIKREALMKLLEELFPDGNFQATVYLLWSISSSTLLTFFGSTRRVIGLSMLPRSWLRLQNLQVPWEYKLWPLSRTRSRAWENDRVDGLHDMSSGSVGEDWSSMGTHWVIWGCVRLRALLSWDVLIYRILRCPFGFTYMS